MELVYLWVEEYKNIKNQGFNFSPRFRCEYDPDTNELTIEENDDYIENFFGENINVTAIVGKNGSGKSSIAEILATFSFEEFLDEKTFLVFFNGNKFTFKQSYTGEKLNFIINNKTKYINDDRNDARYINTLYFGNKVSTIFNNPNMHDIKNYLGIINAYKYDMENAIDNFKYPTNTRIDREHIHKFEMFNRRMQYILNKNKNILREINDMLIFDRYRLELHFYEMISRIRGNDDFERLVEYKKGDDRETILKENDSPIDITDTIVSIKILLYKLLIIFRLLIYKLNRENTYEKTQTHFKDIINQIINTFIKESFSEEDFWSISEIINNYDNKKDIYSEENINDIFNRFKYSKKDIWIEKSLNPIVEKMEIQNPIIDLLYKYGIVRIEYLNSLDDNYTYFSLSSGEREYIETFVTYIYHLFNREKKFIFFFDEVDLALHPNWQKRVIKNMVFYANTYSKANMQLVLTTHSPFLLSDIPKQNIIFLDTDEKGNCIVVDGLNDKKETFGANIHTLLSDSFFMEDGLMGEFAKGKINEIKEFYEKVINEGKTKSNLEIYKNNEKNFWNIQKVIGEPFLKRVIKNQLEEIELILLGKSEAIDKEIKRLQALKEKIND